MRTMLTGPLEVTNEPYAIAKIAGIKLVEGPTISQPVWKATSST